MAQQLKPLAIPFIVIFLSASREPAHSNVCDTFPYKVWKPMTWNVDIPEPIILETMKKW